MTRGDPGGALAGSAPGALIGALLAGLPSYFSRKAKNEDIKDLMTRMPRGATKRDMLTDPAYQADLMRQSMQGGGGGVRPGLMFNMGDF